MQDPAAYEWNSMDDENDDDDGVGLVAEVRTKDSHLVA